MNAAARPPPRPQTHTPIRHRVLYVEHRLVDLLLMQLALRRRPELELSVVQSGAQAVRHAPQLAPSLLLIGLDLPDGHGAEWLHALRATEGCAGIPAVAVSADSQGGVPLHGFIEVWSKPLDLRRVIERLDLLLPTAQTPRPSRHDEVQALHDRAFWTPTVAGARAYDLPNHWAATAAGRQAFQAASIRHQAQE